MIVYIPIKAKDKYIDLCQKTKDSKTYDEFYMNSKLASCYGNAIQDICGISVWGEIIREADMTIGTEEYGTCCGIPLQMQTIKE